MCEGRAGIFVFHTAAETLVLQSAVAASSSTCSQKYQVRAPRTRLSSGDHVEHRSLQHSILVRHTLLHSLSHVRQASRRPFNNSFPDTTSWSASLSLHIPTEMPTHQTKICCPRWPTKGKQLSKLTSGQRVTTLHNLFAWQINFFAWYSAATAQTNCSFGGASIPPIL